VDRTIPAWGLFRLFRVLGDKEVSGLLSLSFVRGDIALTYKQGYVTDCLTDINALTFKSFLVQSGMVTDPSRAESLQTMEQLVEGRVVRSEDTRRFYNSYVRSVVGRIMAEPVQSWSFAPQPSTGPAASVEAVDVCAELFTVVQRHKDVPTMRFVVERLGVNVELTEMLRPECLIHAKAHFRGSALVAEIARGVCPPITSALLDDERNIRILFAFVVTGALQAKSVARQQEHTTEERPVVEHPVVERPAVARPVAERPVPAASATPTGPLPEHARAVLQDVPLYTGRDTLHDVQRDTVDEQQPYRQPSGQASPDEARPETDLTPPESTPLAEITPERFTFDPTISDPHLENLRESELDVSLQTELARTARLNHYELLELNPNGRLSAVRMAVLRAARKYSRARYEGAVSGTTLASLDQLLARIRMVGEVLGDENARITYNRQQGISTPGLEGMLMSVFAARHTWRQGMTQLESRNAAAALELFESAEGQDGEEPDYLCAQCRALLAMPADEETYARIDGLLETAFGFDRDLIEAHMVSAIYLGRKNEPDEARVHIRKILLLDGEHREAKSFKVKPKTANGGTGQANFMKKSESLWDKALKLVNRKV
jgi:hypothetical protein